jgi:hypothetical protein
VKSSRGFLRTTRLLAPGLMLLSAMSATAQTRMRVQVIQAQHDVSPKLTAIVSAPATSQKPKTTLISGMASGFSFDGLSVSAGGGWSTPDANGAVGATQYVQWVNTQLAVYDKTSGAPIYGPVPGNTMWSGFNGLCATANNGDPIVQYDKLAGRWVLSQRAMGSGGPYYQCVAVSTTSDATGSYYRYAFPLPNYFPDYPKIGIWPDAYYLSINELSTTYAPVNALACALDRNNMLNGNAATAQCFGTSTTSHLINLLPSDLDGVTPPPAGSPNYFMNFGPSGLNLWKFHVDFTNPTNSYFSGPARIAVAPFTRACNGGVCIPQAGTTQLLDSLGDRLMYRLAYRNFGDHESLVANHAIVAGSSVGVRWYEIQNPGGTPVVFQQGTFAPDSNYRWMGSIAMDKTGDIAVGYNVSGSGMNPAVRFTGRVPADPPDTLEAETSIIEGTGAETSIGRWGDYSSISVDPTDDCTFWYTNEYLQTSGSRNWNTRIASFKFPSCH